MKEKKEWINSSQESFTIIDWIDGKYKIYNVV